MLKIRDKKIIFFTICYLLFFLLCKLSFLWSQKTNINLNISIVLSGILFVVILGCVFYFSKIGKETDEKWDLSIGAKCKGGNYFRQGDSMLSKICRELDKTEEGKEILRKYNCPKGTVGQPGKLFEFSHLSNENWQNERVF